MILPYMMFVIFAATVPLRNKFIGPIQDDQGKLCSNVATGGTAWTLQPCTTDNDTMKAYTSGKLFSLQGDPTGDSTADVKFY